MTNDQNNIKGSHVVAGIAAWKLADYIRAATSAAMWGLIGIGCMSMFSGLSQSFKKGSERSALISKYYNQCVNEYAIKDPSSIYGRSEAICTTRARFYADQHQ